MKITFDPLTAPKLLNFTWCLVHFSTVPSLAYPAFQVVCEFFPPTVLSATHQLMTTFLRTVTLTGRSATVQPTVILQPHHLRADYPGCFVGHSRQHCVGLESWMAWRGWSEIADDFHRSVGGKFPHCVGGCLQILRRQSRWPFPGPWTAWCVD